MLRPCFFCCTFSGRMTELKRSLRLTDGLAMVVGMTVGAGIFRTPGIVAARLGRPGLTFVVWVLGAALASLGAGLVALFTGINLVGVASGRWVQNVVTAAKLLALGGVVVIAFARGTGAGWHGALPGAPVGLGVWVAIALAAHPVIWTYYGYPDLAKIAGEVVHPSRTLPRILLGGLAATAVLYL